MPKGWASVMMMGSLGGAVRTVSDLFEEQAMNVPQAWPSLHSLVQLLTVTAVLLLSSPEAQPHFLPPAPSREQGSQSSVLRVGRSAAASGMMGAKAVALVGLGKSAELGPTNAVTSWGPSCFHVSAHASMHDCGRFPLLA